MRISMKRVVKWVVGLVLAALFVGTFVFLYRKSQPAEVVYATHTVRRATLERSTVLTGTVEPRDEVLIKPQISGIISELYKKAGDMVKAGEVIARVKVVPDMSQLSQAENRVRLAAINLRQAQNDFVRTKKLFDDQLISREEYEKGQQALSQAREESKAATDALNIVRDGVSSSNASYSTTLIRSTIDGQILEVPVKVGNSVIMSNTFNDGTTIASVADMRDLIFKGYVDETEIGLIHEGMPVKVSVGALTGKEFSATLEYIAPKVSSDASQSNRFEIKAALRATSGAHLRAGYSANAEVVLERAEGVLTVPEGCLSYEGNRTYVEVLTQRQPQKFVKRQVVTGLSDGINIEIKSGLKAGEQVKGEELQNEEQP